MRTAPNITPTVLGDNPELAVLDVLGRALDTAKFALIAVHPQLGDADPDAVPSDLVAFAAQNVLIAADALQQVLTLYHDVTRTESTWIRLSRYQAAPPGDDF